MNFKIFKYGLIIGLFILAGNIAAQEFKLTADKTTVRQNERFQVYFTFEGGSGTTLQGYRPPSFENFRILSGPNQSSSMTIINGSISSTVTYSYILVAPNRTGKFKIGSASLKYKGDEYKTNSLVINVVKGSGKKGKAGSQVESEDKQIAKNVFIRAIADKRNVVKGEQVTVTYKLYTRLNISSPQISKLPQYKGFWAKELATGKTINFDVEMYKGVRYRSAVLKKVALFPTKSGKLTVTPFALDIPVMVRRKAHRSNDPFDAFFNDSFFGRTETVNYTATSNAVTINVAPLPEEGKPASFTGAVGDFDFKATLDKNKVEANDAVTIKLEVSGKGNIELLDLPDIKLPPGFEKYDPKISKNINNKGSISGKKTVEYLIVPRVPGVKIIEPVEFSYYNPKLKKYIIKSSPKFTITVTGSANSEYAGQSSTGFSKEDVKLLSQDIRFIQTSNFKLVRKAKGSLIKSWFWGMLVAPLLLMFIVIGYKKRHDKLTGNVHLVRSQKAEKKAKARLKTARKALDEKDIEKYYEEISKGLFGYLEDKLQLQKADLSVEKVVSILEKNGIDQVLIERVKNIIEKCEYSRFAPNAKTEEATTTLYNETIDVIVNLENRINSKKKNRK